MSPGFDSIEATTPEEELPSSGAGCHTARRSLTLTVLWCPEESWRVGEIAVFPVDADLSPSVLGRGPAQDDDPGPRLVFARATLSGFQVGLPIGIAQLSRVQALLRTGEDGELLEIQNVGRTALLCNGSSVQTTKVKSGDVLQFGRQLLLLCIQRAAELSRPSEAYPVHEFGKPDAFGIVGESLSIRELRCQIAFVAARRGHVLVSGPSGSGKELVAHAIHSMSARQSTPMVCRNAATLPVGLIDAELFGNAKNYPNAGMSERPGLIGEADRTTLYLDEFAELPETSQTHLLRVLDAGEYQRLGEAFSRNSDFRLIAATNRPDDAIKEDLLGRFPLRIRVPDLNQRREDVPLLLLHLLRSFAAEDRKLAAQFFQQGDPQRPPAVSMTLIRVLVQRQYRTNVRELESLLWSAIQSSDGHELGPPADWHEPRQSTQVRAREVLAATPGRPSPQEIRTALERHNGEIEATWRALGLKNRYALRRLLVKHGIEIRRRL